MKENMGNFYSYNYSLPIDILKPEVVKNILAYCVKYSISTNHTSNSAMIQIPIITFFFIEEIGTVRYHTTYKNFEITFRVEHKKFLQFLLFYTIASAMLSTFSVSFFLWFIAISFILFFGIRFLYIRSFISGLITYISISEHTEDELTEQQQQWIENPHVCPACGTEINSYSINCSECGLFIKHLPPISRFSFSENLDSYSLHYTITDEKN